MKAVTKSELPQPVTRLLNRLKLLFISFIALIIAAILPELVLEFAVKKADLRQMIRNFAQNSQLAITFDDISISAYTGITLNNIKISHDPDFSRGRVLLSAKEFRIRPAYGDYFRGKLTPVRFSFRHADVKFWLEDNALSPEMLLQLQNWYASSQSFEIRFENSRLELNLKRDDYDKDQWVIADISGTFSRTAEMTFFEFSYDTDDWGDGSGEIIAASCFLKECGIEYSSLLWNFENMNLARLNWLLKSLTIAGGRVSGNLKKSQNFEITSKEQTRITESDLEIKVSGVNISLLSEESPYLDKIAVDMSFRNRQNDANQEITASGIYNETPFELKMITGKNPLPDFFQFITENKGKPIQLPGNISLRGLNWLKINLQNGKNGFLHTISTQISNGSIQFNNEFSLKIPLLNFESTDNKFNLQAEIAKNNSSLKIHLEGEAVPFLVPYRPIAYPLMTGYRGPERNIAAYKLKAKGDIATDKFFYSDLQPLVAKIKKIYEQSLIEGLHHSYAPSRVRDREFFKKYIENLNLNLSVLGREVWLSDRDNLSINGEIKTDYAGAKVTLKDTNGENQLDFQYSYLSNIPFISGRYDLSLRDGKVLLGELVDSSILESFEGVRISYSFNAQGERPADIYLSERGRGDWYFSNVVFGAEARKRYIVTEWDTLKFTGTKTGSLFAISRYEAENKNFILSGSVNRKETNLQSEYVFTFQLKQKN